MAAADQAKSNSIYIVTVGLGADVDAALLSSIASSPADYQPAPTSADLAAIYNDIAASMGCLVPAASCPGATITSIASGDWQTAANWDQNRVPDQNDVVLVQGASQLVTSGRLQLEGLCNYGVLQGGNATGLQIMATQFITNYGQIVGRDGEPGSAGGCGQPGQGVTLGGTEAAGGIPIGNWGTIRAGLGGAGEACGGAGGSTLVYGRDTTNQGTICGGAGGDLVGNVAGARAGKGGDTHLWGKWGGPGFLANTGLACGGDGGNANPQATVKQHGGCGGVLKLISLPEVLLDGGTHYAGHGGQGVNGGAKGCDGKVYIEPGVISLSGPDTTVWGGDVAVVGGADWDLDLRDIGPITATGLLELAAGPGGSIDLRGNAGQVFQAAETKISADTLLLDPGVTPTELAGGEVETSTGRIARDVSLIEPPVRVVEPGVITEMTLTLLNGGPEADTFTLAVEDQRGWDLSGFPGTVEVAALGSRELTLAVQPVGKEANVVTVRATSQGDPNVSASAEMTLSPGLEVGARIEVSALVLTWLHVSTMESYQIWRDTSPFFAPVSPPASLVASGLPPAGCTQAGETIACPLPGGVGDPDASAFYVTRGIRSGGSWTDFSRTGEFDFRLVSGG